MYVRHLSCSLNEFGVTDNGERGSKELPVSFFAGFKHCGRDLETRWGVGASWDAGNFDGGFIGIIVILEGWEVLGIPESNRTLHVAKTTVNKSYLTRNLEKIKHSLK